MLAEQTLDLRRHTQNSLSSKYDSNRKMHSMLTQNLILHESSWRIVELLLVIEISNASNDLNISLTELSDEVYKHIVVSNEDKQINLLLVINTAIISIFCKLKYL